MREEAKVTMKRKRQSEGEGNALEEGNKKIKISRLETGKEVRHDHEPQFATHAYGLRVKNIPAAPPLSTPSAHDIDDRQSQPKDEIRRDEKDHPSSNREPHALPNNESGSEYEGQAPKRKSKTKRRSKKVIAPPPSPAIKIGDAFFEPGCPSIGCFLPAKTKGTRRPEKKDMIWRCHWEGCDKINWSLYRLNRHIKQKHTQNKFWICQKEGQAYPSKEEFEEHQKETSHVNTEMGR
ncbi:hypothetical protein BKA64DRAFT_635603 [Cadophora sp. MPI-SDFR-AT-0126]|nr:hypothetical protein BKA64DRAFT_635603 [Leotiomycetes sp. MPI-SDFR-AT-0126]